MRDTTPHAPLTRQGRAGVGGMGQTINHRGMNGGQSAPTSLCFLSRSGYPNVRKPKQYDEADSRHRVYHTLSRSAHPPLASMLSRSGVSWSEVKRVSAGGKKHRLSRGGYPPATNAGGRVLRSGFPSYRVFYGAVVPLVNNSGTNRANWGISPRYIGAKIR